MGKHFGNLGVKIRGIIYYKLSPYEMKPFAKAFSYGAPNVIPRVFARIETWLPPFIAMYLIYAGVEHAYHVSKRKDPSVYAREVDPDPPKVCRRQESLPRYNPADDEDEICDD